MPKLPLPLLLLLALAPARAATLPYPCHQPPPSKDKAKWEWVDRDCHHHKRADLDHMLADHKLWIQKYNAYLKDPLALAAHGALKDPLRADLSQAKLQRADLAGVMLDFSNLSGVDFEFASLSGASLNSADLSGADFEGANLSEAHLNSADLSGADIAFADLTKADLQHADLTSAECAPAHLIDADLRYADLTGAIVAHADLTGANLSNADLTDADLIATDLSHASLNEAELTSALLYKATLTDASLNIANLTRATLAEADLTRAYLYGADLSRSDLEGTDFSDADLTRASLWYADFEPKVTPPINTIARADGLDTLRWYGSFDEICYRGQLDLPAETGNRKVMAPPPSFPDRWLLWLSMHRERLENKKSTWRELFLFLRRDIFFQGPSRITSAAAAACENSRTVVSPNELLSEDPASTQSKYQVLDVRTALRTAGYQEDELQVNLAYQRHSQSTLGMILYDWTCEYGAAPSRPLFLALLLALLATPLYWLGFRHSWFGARLLLVERHCESEVETNLGDLSTLPKWREPLSANRPANWLRRLIAPSWPRLRWGGKLPQGGCSLQPDQRRQPGL